MPAGEFKEWIPALRLGSGRAFAGMTNDEDSNLGNNSITDARLRFLLRDFTDWQDADQSSQRDDKAADPHPDNQGADENFERCLITIELAEAGENQINIFAQAALVHGATDGRLLRREKLQRWAQDSLILATVKDAESTLDAKVGCLLGAR